MTTGTTHAAPQASARFRGTQAKAGRFLLRFVEWQIPMALGALACYLLGSLVRASPAYAPVYHPGTVLFFVGDLFFLTVPVVTWMLVRGHAWRHGVGMAAAMLAPVAAIVAVGALTGYDSLLWLVTAMYPAMSLGMLAYMLLRWSDLEARPRRLRTRETP